MEILKANTIRLALVIEECGQPQVYTLWLPPKKDRHFQAQLRRSCIVTIQKSASGSDFGCVGLIERPGAMYLEFPKSLKRFEDRRIVGIKWDLVKT